MAIMSEPATELEQGDHAAEEKSFFDVFQEKLKKSRKLVPIHQLAIVAKLSPSAQDIGDHFESRVDEVKNKIWDKNAGPSGFLFIYPQVCLHVIEGTSTVIKEVIRSTARDIGDGMILQAKILNISHDIQRKLFHFWCWQDIKGGALRPIPASDLTVPKQVLEILAQILHLGVYLSDVSVTQLKNVMESIMEGASDMIPPEGKLKSLVEEPSLWSVEEYVKRHLLPNTVVLDEEYVWPAPDKLIISYP